MTLREQLLPLIEGADATITAQAEQIARLEAELKTAGNPDAPLLERIARLEILLAAAGDPDAPLLAEIERLKALLPAPPPPQADYSLPTYSIHVDQVQPGATSVMARVRRSKRALYSVSLRWNVDTRVSAPYTGYALSGSGEFVFDYDVDEIEIPIALPRAMTAGRAFAVVIGNPRTYSATVTITQAKAIASLDPVASPPPPLPADAKSRVWNKHVNRPVPADWLLVFKDDLLTDFEANDTGKRADGTPCYLSRLSHGRMQDNGESGLYTDPVLYPQTTPYQIIDGRRALVAEKLDPPVHYKINNQMLVCSHSAPIVSTEKMPLFGYGRFEYRFALPNPTRGMWPAGWQLCLPHWRWPDNEHDTVEISFNKDDHSQVLPYTTHWWDNNGAKNQGQHAQVFNLFPGFRHQDFHTYAMDWTPEQMRWYIDDVLVFSAPNRFILDDPAVAARGWSNKQYMMLQIAIGGAGGDASLGTYPAHMLVDYIAHYAMPA